MVISQVSQVFKSHRNFCCSTFNYYLSHEVLKVDDRLQRVSTGRGTCQSWGNILHFDDAKEASHQHTLIAKLSIVY